MECDISPFTTKKQEKNPMLNLPNKKKCDIDNKPTSLN